MSIALRPFQQQAGANVLRDFQDLERLLLIMATGAGKTETFVRVAHFWQAHDRPVLILADRDQLVQQALDKCERSIGIRPGREQAQMVASRDDRIVVSSVQTMVNRLHRWPRDHFGLVIADEAHGSLADGWQGILEHFGRAKKLGVTATPYRADRRLVMGYYEKVSYEIGMLDLIREGYLAGLKVRAEPIQIPEQCIRVGSDGDVPADQADDAVRPYFREIATKMRAILGRRQTIVFLASRASSRAFADILRATGLNAVHVDGESRERAQVLSDFSRRRFQILCNPMFLAVGYDEPSIQAVVNLRMTSSRALMQQMVGRGTRVLPGLVEHLPTALDRRRAIAASAKPDMLLLDFLYEFDGSRLATSASAIARDEAEEQQLKEQILATANGQAVSITEIRDRAKRPTQNRLIDRLTAMSQRGVELFDATDFALLTKSDTLVDYEPLSGWERLDPTPGQLEALQKLGMTAVASRGHASALLDVVTERRDRGLATPKQLRTLVRFGVLGAEEVSFQDASTIIGEEIARRGGTRSARTATSVAA